jgi:hypothetical protein
MLPAQRKKVDMKTMTEEEKKLFMLYGKLPTHKNVLTKVQKDRKYFDSGDYALSKAGVAPQSTVGTAIPSPDTIPHATPPSNLNTSQSGTPMNSPGLSGFSSSSQAIPIGVGHSPTRETPLITDSLHEGIMTSDAPSTSPTSSYPLSTEMASSPLNPATSHTHANDIGAAAPSESSGTGTLDPVAIPGTKENHPGTVDLTTIVPGLRKSDLPTSATPLSGEEADTEMA